MKAVPPKKRTPSTTNADADSVEVESLKDAVTHTLDEARMVLPGIQALFGFQLIAVFSDRFDLSLDEHEQWSHLAAIFLTGVAIALIMASAAYHRQTEQGQVSAQLLRVASTLVSSALLPLAIGLCIDIYLVARMVTHQILASALVAGALASVIGGLWFVFPRWRRRRPGRH